MKHSRPKNKHEHDLAFPPSYSEQAKYLALADEFLSKNGSYGNVVPIDSHKNFQRARKGKKAA